MDFKTFEHFVCQKPVFWIEGSWATLVWPALRRKVSANSAGRSVHFFFTNFCFTVESIEKQLHFLADEHEDFGGFWRDTLNGVSVFLDQKTVVFGSGGFFRLMLPAKLFGATEEDAVPQVLVKDAHFLVGKNPEFSVQISQIQFMSPQMV